MRAGVLLGLGLVVVGCSQNPEPPPAGKVKAATAQRESIVLDGPPEVRAESDPGFSDLIFYVESAKLGKEGFEAVVTATDKGAPVGFPLVLSREWLPFQLDPNRADLIMHDGTVTLKPSGVKSDRLIPVLQEAYGLQQKSGKFPPSVYASAVALEGNPSKLPAEPCHIKLFLGDEEIEGQPYAEMFLVIDVGSKMVRLGEKDTTYREDVVRFFSGEAKTRPIVQRK